MSAVYKSRQEGEILLTQQEQVEEDKSRVTAKTTELYYMGRMGSLFEINELLGNFFALMNVIIQYDERNQPILWQEIAKFDKIIRTAEGRKWCEIHRNMKEVLFNVIQDIQSVIAGFVSEARKQGYKDLLSTGTAMSSLIFTNAQLQATVLRNNFQSAVVSMSAGTYKDSTLLFKVFFPETKKRDRDSSSDNNNGSPSQTSNRQRTNNGDRNSSSQTRNAVTPSGSPTSTSTTQQGPPGKKVFAFEGTMPSRLPHPGAIFPHPTRPTNLTVMCCRSAFSGRECTLPSCTYYHFPNQLSSISRELKSKLKTWVTDTPSVKWHGDAVNWATPGTVSTSTRAPSASSAPR